MATRRISSRRKSHNVLRLRGGCRKQDNVTRHQNQEQKKTTNSRGEKTKRACRVGRNAHDRNPTEAVYNREEGTNPRLQVQSESRDFLRSRIKNRPFRRSFTYLFDNSVIIQRERVSLEGTSPPNLARNFNHKSRNGEQKAKGDIAAVAIISHK